MKYVLYFLLVIQPLDGHAQWRSIGKIFDLFKEKPPKYTVPHRPSGHPTPTVWDGGQVSHPKSKASSVTTTSVKAAKFLTTAEKFALPFKDIAKGKKYSNSHLNDVSLFNVLISIPSDEAGYRNIFDTFKNDQLKNMLELRSTVMSDKSEYVQFTSSSLLSAISEPENAGVTVVIIGHNDHGIIWHPDGSGDRISDLDEAAKVNDITIIYLSCNANRYTDATAAGFKLYYSDAIYLTNMISDAYKDYSERVDAGKPAGDFLGLTQDIIDIFGERKKWETRYKIAAYGTVGGAGLYLYIENK